MDSLTIACHAAALADPTFKRPSWAPAEYRVLEVEWRSVGQYSSRAIDNVPGVLVMVREFLGGTKILL